MGNIWSVSSGERTRFEVILESIENKIGVLANGHLALNDKFDRLEGKFDRLSEDVALIKFRVQKIEHHVGLNGVAKARTTKPITRKPARRKRR